MELNFDKEIDAILRRAAQDGENAFSGGKGGGQMHLDADQIAAFAENALPESAKARSTAHLADCDRCRMILSNLIALRAETESEIVHAEKEEKTLVGAPPVLPWYRKLFAFPNLAYSLGALALVFGSLIVFTILQGGNDMESTVSQSREKPLDTKSAPAASSANSATDSINNSPSMMTDANGNSNSVYFSNEAVPHTSTSSTSNTNSSSAAQPVQPAPVADGVSRTEPTALDTAPVQQEKNELAAKPVDDSAAADVTQNNKEQAEEKDKQRDKSDTEREDQDALRVSPQQPKNVPSTSGATATTTERAKKSVDKRNVQSTGETTSAGGKTFRREGGAWVDTAYQSGANMQFQQLARVRRGSGEYKKLDADLRRIADNLGGIVIVNWKGKNYRIE